MAKHPRKRHNKAKRRPVYAWPLAPEAFRQAVLRAAEAAGKPHPLLHERVTPHIKLWDGNEELAITLTDTPVLRAMLTLRECFPQEREWLSACRRHHALEGLFGHPALAPWVTPVGETSWQVDDAVLFVAATAPLDAKGEFLLEPFCEALTRWAKEHPDTGCQQDSCEFLR
jgi:hypothetical protein